MMEIRGAFALEVCILNTPGSPLHAHTPEPLDGIDHIIQCSRPDLNGLSMRACVLAGARSRLVMVV